MVVTFFKSAVMIDPKFFSRDLFEHLFKRRFDLIDGGNAGRMDVINSGTDFGTEIVCFKRIQDLQV